MCSARSSPSCAAGEGGLVAPRDEQALKTRWRVVSTGSHFREPPCKLFQALSGSFRQTFSSSKASSDSRSWHDPAVVFALQARGHWFDPSCAHPEIPGQHTDLGLSGRGLKIV